MSPQFCGGVPQKLDKCKKDTIWFQQYSATAHTNNVTMNYLKDKFNNRVISKPLWPPRSPDLTVPDHFFVEPSEIWS